MQNKFILFLSLIFVLSHASFCQEISASSEIIPTSKKPFSTGESIEFPSEILQENRVLNIYLPASYHTDTLRKYPVIYLLDGSASEDFIHIAGLVQFGSFPWINMVPESIVIGISNIDRRKDFTYPSNNKLDQTEFPTSGNSKNFIRFIDKELQPFIKTYYKTTQQKTLIGQSLGGLLATEILFTQPDLFDNYIIISPSLWWDDQSLLNSSPSGYESMKSIFVAVGKEGDTMENSAKSLYQKLVQQEHQLTSLYFQFFEQQNHGDALHLAVYSAFGKIFGEKEE